MSGVSIVVPTLNEVGNVELLASRITTAMNTASIPFEIIFIDDHSSDGTLDAIARIPNTIATRAVLKQGKPGKAFSILEGNALATYDVVCMIDADLQYPPEAIPELVKTMGELDLDIVLTRRAQNETSVLRHVLTLGFNLVFVRMLFGIGYDTQSGLKLFKKSILASMSINPSPWTFDLEFIVRALMDDRRIASRNIQFGRREIGDEKVHFFSTSLEIGRQSLLLRRHVSYRKLASAYRHNVAAFDASIKPDEVIA